MHLTTAVLIFSIDYIVYNTRLFTSGRNLLIISLYTLVVGFVDWEQALNMTYLGNVDLSELAVIFWIHHDSFWNYVEKKRCQLLLSK